MAERPKPYIGVSGVINKTQEKKLINLFESHGLSKKRQLMLGVKAVHKTQYLDTPNKYGDAWYPVGESPFAAAIEADGSNVFGVAQVYLDSECVEDAQYRRAFMAKAMERGANWIKGVQYDSLPWHTNPKMLDFLETVKTEYDVAVLLQCHDQAMQALGPERAAKMLGKYAPVIDYLLLDASHGKGVNLNPNALQPFVETFYTHDELNGTAIGVAGGLDDLTISTHLPELLANYPDLSWDSEGKLHPIRPDGSRPLDMQVVNRYFRASAQILEG